MKKIIISLAVLATLGLAACAGTQPNFNSPQVVFKGQ